MAAGANDYIQKPLALDKFSKALESILHRWLPMITDEIKASSACR